MNFAKSIISKYIEQGIIKDNTKKIDWVEIIGGFIVGLLIGALAYFYFSLI